MLATVGLRRALRSFEGDGYNLQVFVYEEQHDFQFLSRDIFKLGKSLVNRKITA